ncbi:hypothetical protein CDV36_002041 [Fusarium kuroshium]|uniref:Uncharacterized protein n=1 Tax=Fusarium kuroshium TaxID=2010991 RepID=A0A3M2SM19_9HYPO|nr:hypothetical protein CDV36_002041 [Fusarium kuroshium]
MRRLLVAHVQYERKNLEGFHAAGGDLSHIEYLPRWRGGDQQDRDHGRASCIPVAPGVESPGEARSVVVGVTASKATGANAHYRSLACIFIDAPEVAKMILGGS